MKRTLSFWLPKLYRERAMHALQGNLDVATWQQISGWVRRPETMEPLTIDVLLDGYPVASGMIADVYRADVQAAGFGHGRYGFDVSVPQEILPELLRSQGRETTVLVRESASGAELLTGKLARPEQFLLAPSSTLLQKEKAESEQSAPQKPTRQSVAVAKAAPAPTPKTPSYRVNIEKLTPEGELVGWAVNLTEPQQTFSLEVHIDGAPYATIENTVSRGDLVKHFGTDGRGGFRALLPLRYLPSGDHEISLISPDKNKIAARSVTTQQNYSPREMVSDILSPSGVVVVVPIYNAPEDVEVCISRLKEFTDSAVNVILIDDCSTDPRISDILSEVDGVPPFTVLRNEENLGFTRTVNRGLREAGDCDVVILNSDARVTPRWLPGMLAAARSMPRVATVTPMSDRAGAFSAPNIGNENDLPPGIDEDVYARAFRRRQFGTYPVVPTGNGFCMLMTRAAIREIGFLDEESFPRGYGEENDFCMRAVRAGWHNIIDDRTYVFHERTKSFGESKTQHIESGMRVIHARYPEYRLMTSVYREGEGILLARAQARLALADCTKPESILPRALFVVSTSTGGTPQTNLDLMLGLTGTFDCWLLRCDSRMLELSHLIDGQIQSVTTHKLERPIDPITHRSIEYDRVVESWLAFYDIELMHIRHLAWHSLNLPALAKRHQITVVHSFHDFYALCPSVNLVNDGTFCGGDCSQIHGSCEQVLWSESVMPPVNQPWVAQWRARYQKAVSYSDAFVTTSDAARDRLLAYLPGIPADKFFVIPHGRDFQRMGSGASNPRPDEAIRILVPGNVSINKGLDVICGLADHDIEKKLEFHILGNIIGNHLPPSIRIVRHGAYNRDNFFQKVEAIAPHLGAVFSIWDETWCHTLTEMWAAGLPVAVLDFPTVGQRVRESGAGWVLEHHDVATLYEQIISIMTDNEELHRAHSAVRRWQTGEGAARTTRYMAAAYLDVYRSAARSRQRPSNKKSAQAPRIAVVVPGSSTDLERGNASSYIRVWNRTRNRMDRSINYIRMNTASLLANTKLGRIDGAIIQRNAIPGPWVDRFIEAASDSKLPYFMELDDDLLNVPEDKDPDGAYAAYRPRLERLIRAATAVTVSTQTLKERLEPLNGRVEVVPNALCRSVWALGDITRVPDGTIRALYMGTPTHDADLEMILPALEQVAAERPHFKLLVIGVSDAPLPQFAERVAIPSEARNYPRFVRWLAEQRRRVDFGIAPLEDTPFNAAKSDLKILDYGGLGLPVVASEHPVYSGFSDNEGVTLVRDDIENWKEALLDHIDKPVQHAAAGRILRDFVFRYRSLEPSICRYDEFIETSATTAHRRKLGDRREKIDA